MVYTLTHYTHLSHSVHNIFDLNSKPIFTQLQRQWKERTSTYPPRHPGAAEDTYKADTFPGAKSLPASRGGSRLTMGAKHSRKLEGELLIQIEVHYYKKGVE